MKLSFRRKHLLYKDLVCQHRKRKYMASTLLKNVSDDTDMKHFLKANASNDLYAAFLPSTAGLGKCPDTKVSPREFRLRHSSWDLEAPDARGHLFSLEELRYNKRNQPLVTNADSTGDCPRWESKGGES
jgi:hypothetical protein